MWLILQALEHGAKLNAEQLHLQELGIATLTSCFVNANRDPKKGEPAKPSDFFYFKPEDDGVKIPPGVCDAFFSLAKEQLLMPWMLSIAPVDKLRRYKADRPVSKPRAWVGEGLLLVMPRCDREGMVRCPFALVNGVSGLVLVRDVDTGNEFTLKLAPGGQRWVLDGEFAIA